SRVDPGGSGLFLIISAAAVSAVPARAVAADLSPSCSGGVVADAGEATTALTPFPGVDEGTGEVASSGLGEDGATVGGETGGAEAVSPEAVVGAAAGELISCSLAPSIVGVGLAVAEFFARDLL